MNEKAKRKEKLKNQPRNPVFVVVALFLFLIFAMSAGMVFYFSVMPDPAQIAFEQTTTMIVQANNIAMTMIAASETKAVADVTATAANATTRAELRLTTTANVQHTEQGQSTIDADARRTELFATATAIYLMQIVSQTAIRDGLTATAAISLQATANAPVMTPSPTAGNCGFMMYSGIVESPHASAEWREALDMASVDYRSARLLFDAFEAINDCQGGIIPLPYQCEIMEIAIDISQDDWTSFSERYLLLTPILTSIDVGNICNTPEARLRVYFYRSETDFYLWEANRQTALVAWQSGVDSASFWAYGRWRDSGQ